MISIARQYSFRQNELATELTHFVGKRIFKILRPIVCAHYECDAVSSVINKESRDITRNNIVVHIGAEDIWSPVSNFTIICAHKKRNMLLARDLRDDGNV